MTGTVTYCQPIDVGVLVLTKGAFVTNTPRQATLMTKFESLAEGLAAWAKRKV